MTSSVIRLMVYKVPWKSYEKKEFEKAFDNYKKMTKEYALCNS